MTYLADTDPEAALGSLQAAACTYRIAFDASIPGLAGNIHVAPTPAAFGPRAGQKVLSLHTVPKGRAREWPCLPPRGRNPVALPTQQRCVNEQGFSLHAEVRLAIHQRHKLESQAQGWACLARRGRSAKILSHLGLSARAPPRSPARHFALLQTP